MAEIHIYLGFYESDQMSKFEVALEAEEQHQGLVKVEAEVLVVVGTLGTRDHQMMSGLTEPKVNQQRILLRQMDLK